MIKITVDNKTKIEGLPDKYRERIQEAMTLDNDKYHKLKNMGKNVYNVPKVFKFYKKEGDSLVLPRGSRGRAISFIEAAGFDYEIEDNTVEEEADFSGWDPIDLREYQQPIVNSIDDEDHQEGIWEISTGAGKTVMAIEMIRRKGLRAAVFVHNNRLLNQWKEEFENFFGYTPGQINGDEKNIKKVTMCSFATLRGREDLLEQLADRVGLVFVDEAHGVAAKTRAKVMSKLKPHYLYGLTGTAERTDSKEEAIFFYLGERIYKYDKHDVDPLVEVINTKTALPEKDEYHEMVEAMVQNESRNKLIAGTVVGNVLEGRSVLCLTKRIEHFERIREHIGELEGFHYISGDSEDRESILRGMKEGVLDFNAIFGTTKLLATGVDIPKLDTLVIACDLKSSVLMRQSVGRILRMDDDKKRPKIIDIADITRESNGVFKSQFYSRQDVYKSKGWQFVKNQ